MRTSSPSPRSHAPPARLRDAFDRWLDASVTGRLWWIRAPLVPVLAWIAWRHSGDIWWQSVFGGINLAFHEIGHVLFGMISFGSELLTIAGGTILELAVPLVAAGYLAFRQRDAFGAGVCLFWEGTALASVGRYVFDTRSQIMERVSVGPYAGPDDWTYLLGRLDLIRQDRAIGSALHDAGVVVMVAAVAFCVYVLRRMALSAERS